MANAYKFISSQNSIKLINSTGFECISFLFTPFSMFSLFLFGGFDKLQTIKCIYYIIIIVGHNKIDWPIHAVSSRNIWYPCHRFVDKISESMLDATAACYYYNIIDVHTIANTLNRICIVHNAPVISEKWQRIRKIWKYRVTEDQWNAFIERIETRTLRQLQNTSINLLKFIMIMNYRVHLFSLFFFLFCFPVNAYTIIAACSSCRHQMFIFFLFYQRFSYLFDWSQYRTASNIRK